MASLVEFSRTIIMPVFRKHLTSGYVRQSKDIVVSNSRHCADNDVKYREIVLASRLTIVIGADPSEAFSNARRGTLINWRMNSLMW